MQSGWESGFGAAIVIPAIASTIKQAQRESATHLHTLADYYTRQQDTGDGPELTAAERLAASEFGMVLVEQGFNGTVQFLAVKGAVVVGGPFGGVAAQLGITANTIVTPEQTQRFNPARALTNRLGRRPDWVSRLPERGVQRFALETGRLARRCGYGRQPRPGAAPGRAGQPA